MQGHLFLEVQDVYKLTADLSTFDTELAHFTRAMRRINNCLVRAAKL